jgi:GDP-L-fucose synthase
MMNKDTKIYLAGHQGMVGSALLRTLKKQGYENVITKDRELLNLTIQSDVESYVASIVPEVMIIAAAKVGGILANDTYRAEFIYDNIAIETNLIHSAHLNGVRKLLFLGSSCIYPKNSPQPMKEEYLLTGELEPTNEAYAISKIVGIKLCENYFRQYGSNFISIMPTNLYGPNDNFNLETSHVLPAMIRKFHEAKEKRAEHVIVWGTGNPKREFMYVEDMAEASIYILNSVEAIELYSQNITHLNVGIGSDISITELAQLVANIVGYEGEIQYDTTKPDGIERKLLNVDRLKDLGWEFKTGLEDGIERTYHWFIDNFPTGL